MQEKKNNCARIKKTTTKHYIPRIASLSSLSCSSSCPDSTVPQPVRNVKITKASTGFHEPSSASASEPQMKKKKKKKTPHTKQYFIVNMTFT